MMSPEFTVPRIHRIPGFRILDDPLKRSPNLFRKFKAESFLLVNIVFHDTCFSACPAWGESVKHSEAMMV